MAAAPCGPRSGLDTSHATSSLTPRNEESRRDKSIGGDLYVETVASGAPVTGTASNEGFGEVMQGNLESSNVDIVEEMVGMITAQRAYEINAKTIKTVEDMLTVATNVKR